MKKIALVLVVVMLVSGCATHYNYIKKDNPDVLKDSLECKELVKKITTGDWVWIIPYVGIGWGIGKTYREAELYDQCMQGKGYKKE